MEETKTHGGMRPGAGRKAKQIDMELLEKLCTMHCTDEEIASVLGVSVRTIENWRKQTKYAEIMRRGRAKGCLGVRRAQLRQLEAGNATMAIWLGKVMLGQRDTMQITGPNGGPIQTENKLDLSRLTEEELRVLQATLAKTIKRSDV